MYNNPYPYQQQPNPYQQQPNPYQPNPYQAPAGMPMAPTGPAPKKSKAPIFIIIVVVAVLIIGAIVAVLVINGSNKGKDDNTSKQEGSEQEKGPEPDPRPTEKTGEEAPTITFDGFTFKPATTYGANVRAFSKLGTLYEYKDGYVQLADVESYLKNSYTYDPENKMEYPTVAISKDIAAHDTGYIAIFSTTYDIEEKQIVRYENLDTFIAIHCGTSGNIKIGDKTVKCNETTAKDVLSAFPKSVMDNTEVIASYGNGFEVDFMFNNDDETLDEIMINHFDISE